MAALIAAQRDEHGIPAALACRALGVSRSWFYKHEDAALPPQAVRHEQLKAEVKRLFAAHEGKYGSPRITADLREAGWVVSKNTVAAVMRELGLAARRKKKRKATTRPGKGRWRAPDLVRRDFPAQKINQKWYGDHTDTAGRALWGVHGGRGVSDTFRTAASRNQRRKLKPPQSRSRRRSRSKHRCTSADAVKPAASRSRKLLRTPRLRPARSWVWT